MSSQSPQDIFITDFAKPILNEKEKAAIAGAPPVSLDEAAILGAAKEATGLSDFGSDDFRERLAIWLKCFNDDAGLGPLGRAMIFESLVRFASNRLRIEDIIKRHPEILEIEMPKPIIVSGLPRSGTTHLVNLLATHPGLRSMELWESNEPVPQADEMNWESSDANPRYKRSNEIWYIWNEVLEHWSAMHEWAPGHVHEEVELHCFDFSSYYMDWMTPMPEWDKYYFEHDQTPHYAYAKKVLQVMTWLHGPNRWVMKSPQNMENLEALFNVYPDATVVITHRDPVAVLQSSISLMGYADRVRRSKIDLDSLVEYWFDRIEHLMRKCVEDRDRLPQDQVMDVYFHEYMANERRVYSEVCRMADLPVDAEATSRLDDYLTANPRGRLGRTIYDLHGNFGVDIAALRRRFQFYYDRFPVKPEKTRGE